MAKWRILKPVIQENKARQIIQKTNISYSLIRIRACDYQGVRNVPFSYNTGFDIRIFALVPTSFCYD